MAEFLVKIADERGHVSEQLEHGYSESEVRERVSQQGYLVYSVKPRGMFSGAPKLSRGRIRPGLPILTGIELLIKRQKDESLKAVLENVRDRVKGGELLSDAFAAQNMFPRMYTTTLMAGEKSGNLEEVLSRYIAFQRVAMSFKKKLLVSLVYPTLLVSVVLIMVVFLVTYVVPQFAKLFENLGAKLPMMTVFMLAIGTTAQKYVLVFFAALALAVFLLWRWKGTDRGAEFIDRALMAFPLIGEIRLKYQVASLSRMLSTLLQGGIPLVPAMETAGASMTSRKVLNGVARAASRVREGQGLARSLEEQRIFPDLAVEMMEVGESTGALPAMLNSVAEFYEEDVQTALGAAMALIEPILLIFMAVFVGGVLISLYLPIFTLGADVH